MAKSKPARRGKKRARKSATDMSPESAAAFLAEATSLLHTGQPEKAVPLAVKALKCFGASSTPTDQLPAIELIGEIYLELGDPEEARGAFLQAAALDPEGMLPEEAGGGPDKFMWLAQLSVDGGAESVQWFEKGCTVLRREIGLLEEKSGSEAPLAEVKKRNLANALCGAAEVYMTDLSWEVDAEARCEALVTEACMVAPNYPEPLQTLASVRISQERFEDACAALTRSLEMWQDLPPEDTTVPDFPTRISLSRLLMEAEMESEALTVLERLVADDDSSIEAWYLGGWCLQLLAGKSLVEDESTAAKDTSDVERLRLRKTSREWLLRGLKLYGLLEYEDERLKEHAEELVAGLNQELGPPPEDGAEEDEEDEDVWEVEEVKDEDEDMDGA